jgi:adenosylmethionine-8-amino-7-oxononanoate aminotransferase
MSVGAKSGYHDPFQSFFFNVLSVPFPATWLDDADVDAKEEAALLCLDHHLLTYGSDIAAIILEPIVQGASGMRMCRPAFINAVVARVRQFGILVIFDEVMTGFGRTGTLFALDNLDVLPDFLCLSKGITGGFLPLALTVTTNDMYHAFLTDEHYAFAHGHSYTANPLACAAALASLTLLTKSSTQDAIQAIEETHRQGLALLAQTCRLVEHTRLQGSIAAFDVLTTKPEQTYAYLKSACLNEGLLLRPLGTTVYLLPPYSTTPEELQRAYQTLAKILVLHADDLEDQAMNAPYDSELPEVAQTQPWLASNRAP